MARKPEIRVVRRWEALPQILTTKDCAVLLKMSTSNVQKLAKAGQLPTIKFGNLYRFDRDALHKALDPSWTKPEGVIY